MKTFKHMIYGADYNPDQWLKHPEIIDQDFELMPKAGLNSVTVGMFAWKELEPEEGKYCFEWLDDIMDRAAQKGMTIVLGTPSGSRPYWMDRDYPEVRRVSNMGMRYHHGIRHNHCITSPYYRKKVFTIDRMLAERYKNHPALGMWHIGNEFHGECYCDLCQEAFRNWLRNKYENDIEKLNEEWWTYCWSRKFDDFSEIEAPSPMGEYLIHGMNLDWKRFISDQTASFIANEIEAIRSITPDIPITTNLMGRSEAVDQWRITKDLDVVSVDSYPEWGVYDKENERMGQFAAFTFDINRSLKKNKPFYVMECTPSLVNWFDVNKTKKPGMNELSSIQAIAHGAESIQYFQWRSARGTSEKFHGTVIGHNGRTTTRVFKETARTGDVLKQLDAVVGSTTKAEAALIYDWENKWAIGDLMGMTKPLDYDEICEEHYIGFWESGVSVDIISMDQPFDEYKILVAPFLYSIRPGVAQRLKEFTAKGGILILTYGSAYVNENDLCFLGGFPGAGLMDAAGVEAEEIDGLYPEEENEIIVTVDNNIKKYRSISLCERLVLQDDCKILAVYGKDFYAGEPALTEHNYGKGKCYYFATRTEQAILEEFYEKLIHENGIERNMKTELPKGVTVQRREKGGRVFCFIMNFTGEAKSVKLDERIYEDVLTGKTVKDKEMILPAYGYQILGYDK